MRRLPPWFSRWRVILPEDASTGLVPHSAANDASVRRRPGLSRAATSSAEATSGPTPSWPLELILEAARGVARGPPVPPGDRVAFADDGDVRAPQHPSAHDASASITSAGSAAARSRPPACACSRLECPHGRHLLYTEVLP